MHACGRGALGLKQCLLWALQGGKPGLNVCQFCLQVYHLLLKSEDVGNAAINGVSDASESLVGERDDSVEALVRRDAEEELRGVASAEHFVDRREVCGALISVEVWREDASFHALPPEELARPTWPTSTGISII